MNASELGGTLESTPAIVSVGLTEPTWTISLTSDDPGRKIELSVDDGSTYFEPVQDSAGTSSDQVVVKVSAPITHIKFTGAAGDAWVVL